MAGEYITSTGSSGKQFDRSCGRAYWNVETKITDSQAHLDEIWDFQKDAYFRGRRRWVSKGIYSYQAVDELIKKNAPIEAMVPLYLFDDTATDALVYMGINFHRSEIPEWAEVLDYWQRPGGCNRTPLSRIRTISAVEKQSINPSFGISSQFLDSDIEQLVQIWRPFGWTSEGIHQLRNRLLQRDGVWFSGVINRETNGLVSACMGELFNLAGVTMVESTEYGTLPEYQGLGLCTAAISFLNAQILNDTLYPPNRNPSRPVILAELSMTSRSDIAARHAGFRIPLLDQPVNKNTPPFQVLPRNASVLDNYPVNDLNPNIEHRSQADRFRSAYGEDYGYWRNFIVGVLPKASVERYYSAADVSQILSLEERRKI